MQVQGLAAIVEHLNNIRAKLGEDAYRAEFTRLAKDAIRTGPKHEAFWREIGKQEGFEWVDFEQLKSEVTAEPPKMDPMLMVMQALRQTMPGIKTQAQFNAFMAAFDALRVTVNSLCEGDAVKAAEGRKALDMALDLAAKVTQVTEQLRDVPEAATSKAAEEFKKPPAEFGEYDVQRKLLTELEAITSDADLTEWYARTKEQRDSVKSQTLRNALIDAIRNKKLAYQHTS